MKSSYSKQVHHSSRGFALSLVSFLLLLALVLHTIEAERERNQIIASVPEVPVQRNSWFLVPNWLAGTWQASSEIVLDGFDYAQGVNMVTSPTEIKVKRESVIGMQPDNLGRVWYFAGTPYTRTIEAGSFVDYQRMENIALLEAGPDRVTVDSVATVTRLDKQTNHVANEFREETITTYTPLKDGLIQAAFSIKDFDMQGHPLYWSKAVCSESRVKSFERIDHDQRGDIRGQFEKFLCVNGLRDLLASR